MLRSGEIDTTAAQQRDQLVGGVTQHEEGIKHPLDEKQIKISPAKTGKPGRPAQGIEKTGAARLSRSWRGIKAGRAAEGPAHTNSGMGLLPIP